MVTIKEAPGGRTTGVLRAVFRAATPLMSGEGMMNFSQRKVMSGVALAAEIFSLGMGQAVGQGHADAKGPSVTAPVYEVDPLWPKPLPNNWLLGWTIGLWADEQDNIWVIHRGAGGLHNNERGAELSPP